MYDGSGLKIYQCCFLLMFQKPVMYGRESTVSTRSDPSGYLSASLSEWELALQEIHMFIHTHMHAHMHAHFLFYKVCITFSLNCWPCLLKINTWKSEKHDHEHCCLVPSSVCQWCYKQGLDLWWPYQIQLKPTFFCSSLVKNELKWLCSEELKFEAVKYFCDTVTDRMTIWSLQEEAFGHFVCFQANICSHISSPLQDGWSFVRVVF